MCKAVNYSMQQKNSSKAGSMMIKKKAKAKHTLLFSKYIRQDEANSTVNCTLYKTALGKVFVL